MSDRPSVLFVCLGNICRSPMAEGACRAAANAREIGVTVDSAGTGSWHAGEPPDGRAVAMAARKGVDISGLRGRQVQAADFHRFDHIVAMDADNLANLRRMAPADARAHLSLMLDHVPGRAGQSVGDPYYGGPEGFARVWAEVWAGAQGLLDRLTRKG
ncbi:low molecular weight phosphotyrosine protein phosphatase [Paracoccus sp. M683]|uniref:low molecular weight protein-tyrosine-phosphatase n=1 Tax=Paracoccus sp. M683 TaxID=2594268 RepID=UPI00117E998E|nr:low molecular weight protein-tyrosine-phosphatase [Paracoccus sp. M683]TRW96036.1 low molecular weight phosphotyrosine protein phosphatase [Paracoccus sp. M683]